MNVCALDVVARSADFETVAATMEMRAWEWNFLHDIDGETALGEIARQRGVDLDSAIGLVTDAMKRGLVVIPTVTLEAYRSHAAPQTSLRGTSPAVALGSAALADAPFDFATQPPSTGAISFSSDAFDWNAPEPAFEESDEPTEVASAPEKLGSVHYDDRFGVEHPGGPFAAAETHDSPFSIESHHEDEPLAAVPPAPAPEPVAFHVEPFAEVAPHPESAPHPEFASHSEVAPLPEAAPFGEVEPFADVAPSLLVPPQAPAHPADPFAVTAHPSDPFAPDAPHAVDDPFAVAPSENGKAFTNGASLNGHTPVRFDELFTDAPPVAPTHDEVAPAAAPDPAPTTLHFDAASFDDALFTAPQPPHESAPVEPPAPVAQAVHDVQIEPETQTEPGSISFSFSADDPAGTHETFEAHGVRESPEVWTPPAQPIAAAVPEPPIAPIPEPVAKTEPVAKSEPAAVDPMKNTQSLYYEREAIDTDAGREHEEKVKNWKDSLSWREQQQLSEALGAGDEKPGVIGSLLRALGVR
jgi:hypothetical protein